MPRGANAIALVEDGGLGHCLGLEAHLFAGPQEVGQVGDAVVVPADEPSGALGIFVDHGRPAVGDHFGEFLLEMRGRLERPRPGVAHFAGLGVHPGHQIPRGWALPKGDPGIVDPRL